MYSACGRSAATAATANHAVTALWNPHATQRVRVAQIQMVAKGTPGAGEAYYMQRISARGTPGSTITPAITNHSRHCLAPPSGLLMDLSAYSVQPTLTGNIIGTRWVFPAVVGSAIILPFPRGIEIGPGAGLAVVHLDNTAAPEFDITWDWEEDW